MTTRVIDIRNFASHILDALAGAGCAAYPSDLRYEISEALKRHATDQLAATAGMAGCRRASFWLMHAYAHWLRADESLQTWPADYYDEIWPYSHGFRDYLAHWLWSVGIPQLKMPADDLDALNRGFGVGAIPHELMPIGASMYEHPIQKIAA